MSSISVDVPEKSVERAFGMLNDSSTWEELSIGNTENGKGGSGLWQRGDNASRDPAAAAADTSVFGGLAETDAATEDDEPF